MLATRYLCATYLLGSYLPSNDLFSQLYHLAAVQTNIR